MFSNAFRSVCYSRKNKQQDKARPRVQRRRRARRSSSTEEAESRSQGKGGRTISKTPSQGREEDSAQEYQTNLVAAKNVGMLTQAYTSVAKMRARVQVESLDEGTRKTAEDCETGLSLWVTRAKACLAKADTQAVKEGSERLEDLPFDRDPERLSTGSERPVLRPVPRLAQKGAKQQKLV